MTRTDKARARLSALAKSSPTRFADARRADLLAVLEGIKADAYLLTLFVGEETGARGVGAVEVGVEHAMREVRNRRGAR